MKDLLTAIFYTLAGNEQARISEADNNPDKWYEIITGENGLIKTLQKSDTLAETVRDFGQHMEKYRFDEINIAIMENRKSPTCIYGFFSDSLIYSIIHDYFRRREKLKNMRFIGEIIFQDDDTVKFKKDCYNYGEAANIFIDEIAFCYFRNLICYIPDLGEESDPEDGCTYSDFLEIAEGNEGIALHLFNEVTWEYPSTLYEQWDSTDSLEELKNLYKEKPAVYSYTDSGDFVHCNNCDKIMLVPTGADKCPSCYCRGRLAWQDCSLQETSHDELAVSGKYNVVVQEDIFEIISANRQCDEYEMEQYKSEMESKSLHFESAEELLGDFDAWKEQSELAVEKTMDSNFWSSL